LQETNQHLSKFHFSLFQKRQHFVASLALNGLGSRSKRILQFWSRSWCWPTLTQNGLPDKGESRYGLADVMDAVSRDEDKDGASNAEEYYAGTDPLDPQDRLQLNIVREGPNLQRTSPRLISRFAMDHADGRIA
jgi:hypothetical protein